MATFTDLPIELRMMIFDINKKKHMKLRINTLEKLINDRNREMYDDSFLWFTFIGAPRLIELSELIFFNRRSDLALDTCLYQIHSKYIRFNIL